MPEVIIDGVKYVPAMDIVVLDEQKFIDILVEQFWGLSTEYSRSESGAECQKDKLLDIGYCIATLEGMPIVTLS